MSSSSDCVYLYTLLTTQQILPPYCTSTYISYIVDIYGYVFPLCVYSGIFSFWQQIISPIKPIFFCPFHPPGFWGLIRDYPWLIGPRQLSVLMKLISRTALIKRLYILLIISDYKATGVLVGLLWRIISLHHKSAYNVIHIWKELRHSKQQKKKCTLQSLNFILPELDVLLPVLPLLVVLPADFLTRPLLRLSPQLLPGFEEEKKKIFGRCPTKVITVY